jgi:hypothetical protein
LIRVMVDPACVTVHDGAMQNTLTTLVLMSAFLVGCGDAEPVPPGAGGSPGTSTAAASSSSVTVCQTYGPNQPGEACANRCDCCSFECVTAKAPDGTMVQTCAAPCLTTVGSGGTGGSEMSDAGKP